MAWHKMTTEDQVRWLLERNRPRWNAPANDSVVVNSAQGSTTREDILRVIDRLGDERNIIYAPAVAAALQAAKNNHLYNSFDAFALEKRVIDKCEELKWDITSTQNLADVMSWLIENEGVPINSNGEELQQQQRAIEQRTREINEITRNYTAGFKIRTPNGGIKVFDRDGFEIQFSGSGGRAKPRDGGFDSMSDGEISAICEQIRTERRMRSMTKEGLKAEINPVRQQQYESSSTSLGPNPAGVELVLDGKVITTKRELINAINSRNDATKTMLTRNGVTDRVLAKRFEEILNS